MTSLPSWSRLFNASSASDIEHKAPPQADGLVFLELPPDLVERTMRFLTGFDVLRLAMVNRYVYDKQLSGNCAVWRRLAPWDVRVDALYATQAKMATPTVFNQLITSVTTSFRWSPSPPSGARQAYACRRSVRFHEPLQDGTLWDTRGSAIGTASLIDLSADGESFSIDVCFAITPKSRVYGDVGGILLGAQSTHISDFRPDFCEQLIYLDREGSLHCSVTNDKPIVAANLQLNRWYHVALVFDASSRTERVYLDGERIHTVGNAALSSQWAHLTHAQLGSGWISDGQLGETYFSQVRGYAFVGLVDDCRFWNGALDANDVQRLTLGKERALSASCVWSMRGQRKEVDHGMVSLVRCTRPTEHVVAEVAKTEILPMKHVGIRLNKRFAS